MTGALAAPDSSDLAEAHAHAAGLRYTSDAEPGIRRKRAGRGFVYLDPSGHRVRDPVILARISALVIPPAWTDVWISANPRGHLQATGRDQRRRKQHRYHPRWRAVRDEAKFDRLTEFAQALPAIRRRVAKDLRLRGLPPEKVLATVVRLLELTDIRVGNEEYARDNDSYGLTTLRDRHVKVAPSTLRFTFEGKSGKPHDISVHDPQLARIVRRCRDLPGYRLFQYLDEAGESKAVDSSDVNAYLREASGGNFTARHFRTWHGTLHAARALRELGAASSKAEANRNIIAAIDRAATALGNTRAVCRTSYIHSSVLAQYLDGRVIGHASHRGTPFFGPDERALLALLETRAH